MAARRGRVAQREGQSISDTKLFHNKICGSRFLGHRMLDLEACVHFQECERTIGPEEELDRPGAGITGRPANRCRGRVNRGPLGVREKRSGGLFDQFLIPPLQRAVAASHHHDVSMMIAKDLRFDMPRTIHEAFDETLVTPECGHRLAPRGVQEFGNLIKFARDFQPAASAPVRSLDGDGKAVRLGESNPLRGVFHGAAAPRSKGCPHVLRDPAGLKLVAEGRDNLRCRADPDKTGSDNRAGKFRALGQKSVAGMDGVRTGPARDGDEFLNIEICLCRRVAAKPVRFVGKLDIGSFCIDIGVHGHRRDTVIMATADETHGDFPPVSDENFFHGRVLQGRKSVNGAIGRNLIRACAGICPQRSRW